LRGRLMVVGTGGIAVGLAIGSVAIVAAMSYALQRTADRSADSTVAAIQEFIRQDSQPPQPMPIPAGQVAQLLDSQGRVTAGSANADLLVPILHSDELAAALRGARVEVPGDRALQNEPMRVTAVRTGSQVIVVAVPIGGFNQSVSLLRTVLFISQPLLVLVLMLIAWRVIGASLRPVESLRAGAERITGAHTQERLPVPVAHDEIHRLATTLNDMIDRLARARARQRAFVADAAHELRSPLASIRVQLEVAQRLGDWKTVGDDVLIDVDRLSRLVDDLLLLARAESGAAAPRTEVDLDDLVKDVGARYATARVPVEVTSDGPLWTEGDPDGLLRVLVNLMDNAVRHARTSVRLGLAREGAQALITVADDGRGIPAVYRKRVFDRFTRLDEARARDAGGTGLGLAIVRELVRRHDGTVRLEDAVPGVLAEVRLPLSPNQP
jgi:signal transduction histidine kinase